MKGVIVPSSIVMRAVWVARRKRGSELLFVVVGSIGAIRIDDSMCYLVTMGEEEQTEVLVVKLTWKGNSV